MNTVIRKIGNSEGVIIPKDVLAFHDLKAGDEVSIINSPSGITFLPAEDHLARQMKAARECMDKYKVALRELAK
jgi:putative addiction module antidote